MTGLQDEVIVDEALSRPALAGHPGAAPDDIGGVAVRSGERHPGAHGQPGPLAEAAVAVPRQPGGPATAARPGAPVERRRSATVDDRLATPLDPPGPAGDADLGGSAPIGGADGAGGRRRRRQPGGR